MTVVPPAAVIVWCRRAPPLTDVDFYFGQPTNIIANMIAWHGKAGFHGAAGNHCVPRLKTAAMFVKMVRNPSQDPPKRKDQPPEKNVMRYELKVSARSIPPYRMSKYLS